MGFSTRPSAKTTRLTPPFTASTAPMTFRFILPWAKARYSGSSILSTGISRTKEASSG